MCLNDDRPNGERLLATGSVQQNNASNYLLFETELVRTDRLYSSKREILQSMNIEVRTLEASTACRLHWRWCACVELVYSDTFACTSRSQALSSTCAQAVCLSTGKGKSILCHSVRFSCRTTRHFRST